MATLPYKAFPTNEPEARPPDDYFRPDVEPLYRNYLAKGVQELGAGVQKAGEQWGQVQLDGQVTKAMKDVNAATDEFEKLQGADALHQQETYKQRVLDTAEQYKSGLPPYLATEYDKQVRRYIFERVYGKMDTHAEQQGRSVTKQTNDDAFDLAIDQGSKNFNNPEEVKHWLADAVTATDRQTIAEGNGGIPSIVEAKRQMAVSRYYAGVSEAMGAHYPDRAAEFIDQHREELGRFYGPLAQKFRAQALQINGDNVGKAATDAALAGAPIDEVKKAVGPQHFEQTPSTSGLITPGNIDLSKRPTVQNPDGSVSTVRSIGIEVDGKQVLIPTVVGGKVVSNAAAIKHYQDTGENLGTFDTIEHANAAAQNIHENEAQRVKSAPPAPPAPPPRKPGQSLQEWQKERDSQSPQKMNYAPEREGAGTEAINAALTPGGGRVAPDTPAIQEVAKSHGVSPEAVHSMIMLESRGRTTAKTGSYVGLTQIGPAEMKEMANAGVIPPDMTWNKIKDMTADQQIDLYGKYLDYYRFGDKLRAAGVDVSRLSKPEQAAVLQGFQFAPNNTSWIRGLAQGNLDIPTTDTPQARVLGTTSIADMTRYYARRIGQ